MTSAVTVYMALIDGVVRRVRITNSELKLRVACICYRDLDTSPRYEVLDFTADTAAFTTFLHGGVQQVKAFSKSRWKLLVSALEINM